MGRVMKQPTDHFRASSYTPTKVVVVQGEIVILDVALAQG